MARLFIAALALSGLVATSPGQAQQARSFHADYSVTLLGVPVARASFVSWITGDSFQIDGSLSSAGIARIFDQTTGTTTVMGRVSAEGAEPVAYVLDYQSDKKKQRTAIRFSDGSVESTENVPPLRKRGADWVALSDSHLSQVVDPISSTLVRADTPQAVCGRTLRVYDGEMRADLQLSPAGKSEGAAITCNARFVPVSGYRPSRSAIRHLQNKSRIAITFAPLADTGFYAPIAASVGTQIGTLNIRAERIEPR